LPAGFGVNLSCDSVELKATEFLLQLSFAFNMGRIDRNTVYRADQLALGLNIVPNTLGATFRGYDVKAIAGGDSLVGALGFAYVTTDAVVGNN
tara:strand:+ start:1660 stop:1938 length:279 start_codon:yes stop_codon:yes gene_type:complete